jgi:hypothetical protein
MLKAKNICWQNISKLLLHHSGRTYVIKPTQIAVRIRYLSQPFVYLRVQMSLTRHNCMDTFLFHCLDNIHFNSCPFAQAVTFLNCTPEVSGSDLVQVTTHYSDILRGISESLLANIGVGHDLLLAQPCRSRVRFPALPDFLRSSGSGTGSTQPREDNWGATCKK